MKKTFLIGAALIALIQSQAQAFDVKGKFYSIAIEPKQMNGTPCMAYSLSFR